MIKNPLVWFKQKESKKQPQKLSKEIVINASEYETRIALLEEGRVMELMVERSDRERIAGDIYKAIGRPDILTKVGVVRAVILVPALIFSARFGIAGVAIAQMIVTGLNTLVTLFIAGKMLSIPVPSIAAELGPALVNSGVMVVSLQLIRVLLLGWSHQASLLIASSCGLGIYLLSTWLISPAILQQARVTLVSSFSRAAS